MKLGYQISVLRWIAQQPLNRGRRLWAWQNWLRWQIGSRCLGRTVVWPWVEGVSFLARTGMTGVTGNIYAGLTEFSEMGFCLHVLRPGDLFVDVGANVGSYSLLASGATGARSIAVEPLPTAVDCLKANIELNALDELVTLHRCGLAAEPGALRFTRDLDTVNHVVMDAGADEDPGRRRGATLECPVETLDRLLDGEAPTVVKIDVEGFEMEVLRGGATAIGRNAQALIIELLEGGARYGSSDSEIVRQLQDWGFVEIAYDPLSRGMEEIREGQRCGNNGIFVRSIEWARERVETAPSFRVHGVKV